MQPDLIYIHIFKYIYFACLFVTAEPIRPKYFVGAHKIPGKVYGSLKITNLVRKEYYFKDSAKQTKSKKYDLQKRIIAAEEQRLKLKLLPESLI